MNTQPTQSAQTDQPERWTREERRQALNAFLECEEGKRFTEVFSRDCTAHEQQVFLRDAERRFGFDDESIRRWWDSLRALVKEPQFLALAEPLAQNGITVDELYDCLPDEFDPLALQRAIDLAKGIQHGRRGVLAPFGFTNTASSSIEQIRSLLEVVKERVGWQTANAAARQWWSALETADENKRQMELVLLLAEDLANRRATINDFHAASVQANTTNIRAVLHYLDYTRLKSKSEFVGQSTLTSDDTGWWLKPAPRMTRVRGWTDQQIRSRLEAVKAQLDWQHTAAEIRQWWEVFESENRQRLALVLRLAEELATRYVTLTQFHRSIVIARTSDIQANLFYLDYLRLTTNSYTYETVVLDETGKTIERRFDEACHFFEELAPGLSLEMVEIPGGTFLMGSPESESARLDNESPQHSMTISPFHIGKFTITQQQWRVVAEWEKVEHELKPDPSRFKGDDRPVENVSWFDAKEFCARLAKKTGRQYRLPSESEWEYACRAGTTTPFAFGETITSEIVNYDGNYPYAKAQKDEYRKETIPVGTLAVANAFGLFDMHGNVWEWCEDVWHDNYEGAPTDGSAWISGGNSDRRMLRGGSYLNDARNCRSAFRSNSDARSIYNSVGFRVVVSARTNSP